MVRSGRRLSAALLLLVTVLAGCTATGEPGNAGESNVARNAAFNELQTQINQYLAMAPTGLEMGSPSESFFAAGEKHMRQIRRAQHAWLEAAGTKDLPAASGGGTPSKSTVKAYNEAIEAWISAQEEQGVRSRGCWRSPDQASCYRGMIAVEGPRWNAIGLRATEAMQAMTAEANAK